MVVVGFIGSMRSGKTLGAVLEAYKEYRKGRTVYSNIALSFPHKHIDDQMLATMTRSNDTREYDGSVMLIDEVHVYMDSRASAQKKNRLLSYFVTQSGKLDTLVIWTSQFLGQADKRLRLNTQTIYKAERYVLERGRKRLLSQDDKRERFLIDYHKHRFTENNSTLGFVYVKTVTLRSPYKLFGLYDTKERVAYTGSFKEEEEDE